MLKKKSSRSYEKTLNVSAPNESFKTHEVYMTDEKQIGKTTYITEEINTPSSY